MKKMPSYNLFSIVSPDINIFYFGFLVGQKIKIKHGSLSAYIQDIEKLLQDINISKTILIEMTLQIIISKTFNSNHSENFNMRTAVSLALWERDERWRKVSSDEFRHHFWCGDRFRAINLSESNGTLWAAKPCDVCLGPAVRKAFDKRTLHL